VVSSWSIQIVDLVNDRSLPGVSFRVAASVELLLEQPAPGKRSRALLRLFESRRRAPRKGG
jgi:hypothetical protein